jgi:septum site-determining protein MinD
VADAVVYVVTPDRDSIEATRRTAEGLRRYLGLGALGVVVNRLPAGEDPGPWVEGARGIGEVLGVVPEDPRVEEAFRRDLPVVVVDPECPASAAFREIAGRVLRARVPPSGLREKVERAVELEERELGG